MKTALIYASVASMIDQFNRDNIQILLDGGYKVHVAANFEKGNSIDEHQIKQLKHDLDLMEVEWHHIPTPRSIWNVFGIFKAFRKSWKLFSSTFFDLAHFHSPIGAAIGRAAACKSREKGTRIIYTAHGFHFYKGAPLRNWLLYFTMEFFFSFITDTLITINSEDYKRAQKLRAKEVEYIPGVGIVTEKFSKEPTKTKEEIRHSLGIQDHEMVIMSSGELNTNKNHREIIDVLGQINKPFKYLVCGQGDDLIDLRTFTKDRGLLDKVLFLGYRTDIPNLLSISDIFCLPSKREGLSVGLMEAMAAGLPCVVSDIRGNQDLIDENGGYLFDLGDSAKIIQSLNRLMDSEGERIEMGKYNQEKMKQFDITVVNRKMKAIYFDR